MAPPSCLTVTLNPTIDVSTSVRQLINHHKLRCDTALEQVGGGGINVGQVLHSLGSSVELFWPSGRWRGQQIRQRLESDGLNSLTVDIEEENRQCFTVFETDTKHEYRFVLPGPTLSRAEEQTCLQTILQHLPDQYLVLSGSLPPGLEPDFYAQVIRGAKQIQPNLRIVVDTSGAPLRHALDEGVFLFKPSREEFCDVTQHPAKDPIDCVKACRTLITQGQTAFVALTLGAEGSLLVSATNAWRVAPLQVEVSSTVGAGDSYVGGFLHALAQGLGPEQASRVATACAASALQTQGKLAFDPQQIVALAKRVEIEPLHC